jgi:hypothetical protein
VCGPPLWSSGQSSWLRIQRSGFDFRRYQIFRERGPLSLVSTIEELLGRESNGSGLKIRDYCRRDPSRWPRGTLYPQKLALTSLTSGGHSIGIVRSRTQTTEFLFFVPVCRRIGITSSSPTSRGRRKKGYPVPEGKTGPPCHEREGGKYRDIALWVGGWKQGWRPCSVTILLLQNPKRRKPEGLIPEISDRIF